jgi:hypothetical protein
MSFPFHINKPKLTIQSKRKILRKYMLHSRPIESRLQIKSDEHLFKYQLANPSIKSKTTNNTPVLSGTKMEMIEILKIVFEKLEGCIICS